MSNQNKKNVLIEFPLFSGFHFNKIVKNFSVTEIKKL